MPPQVIQTLGEEFQAEAVYLQVVAQDGSLAPLAWYARSRELGAALDRVARDREPATPNVPKPFFGAGVRPAELPLDSIPKDAWIEPLALTDPNDDPRGVLTLIGSPSRGCKELSPEERHILLTSCSLSLSASAEAWRADKLEQQLQFLTKISQGLASRRTIFERLKATVAAAQSATGFDSIQLLTWDPSKRSLLLNVLYIRDTGFVPDNTWDSLTREEILTSSKRFLEDPSPMMFSDPADLETTPPHHRRWMISNGIKFLVFVPLVFEGEHLGTMVITSHYSREGTQDRLRSLTALGGHIAAILQLSLLLADVEESYQRLHLSHRKTIETLALAAEMRDATTGRHLKQLEQLSLRIGKQIGLPPDELQNLTLGAFVHDIGKLHVPDAVLLKPGPLNNQERTLVQQHPGSGEQILIQADVPEAVRQVVRWHHERWDGAGYPDGLAGEQIPLAAQIVTVADVFDALVSRRPYKEAWELDRAVHEIRRSRETQLSPIAVDAFLDVIGEFWQSRPGDLDEAA
jgi:HD-GYP domain-containing protein (c-di-GMP phosphodiesterase class II)